jgi:GDPmannose 4,6-dehydratase
MIKPDVIVHLASHSDSRYCFNNPIDTLHTNGMATVNLCDIIHKNKLNIKLFNASSSEMYKGHIDYEVKENDNNMFHLHPYSIAKIMGYSMVNFYRTTYNLPFSNGVLFTIDSPLKKQTFLFNKVYNHIEKWLNGEKIELIVGNLDSYRNILHADKAVECIYTIINKNEGGNYLICDNKSYKVFDIVFNLYKNAGIDLVKSENMLIEKETNKIVVIIEDKMLGFDLCWAVLTEQNQATKQHRRN